MLFLGFLIYTISIVISCMLTDRIGGIICALFIILFNLVEIKLKMEK